MDCVADRFVATTRGEVIDLATGERVQLAIGSASGETDQRRWMTRCDLFQKLHHPSIAPLVDYGLIGESHRFEAWQSSGRWCGGAASEDARRAAASFLRACGLSTGPDGVGELHRMGPKPIVVPAPAAGYPVEAADRDPRSFAIQHCGVLYVERSVMHLIAELFDQYGCTPQVIGICGPPGAGKTGLIRQLARAARLKGYVPISARLVETPFVSAVDGRSAVVLDDGTERAHTLLDVAIRSPRRHVLLTTSFEGGSASEIVLNRVTAEALASAVLPSALADSSPVRHAAERAQGIPGRFIELLYGHRAARVGPKAAPSRAAEQTPAYGGDDPTPPLANHGVVSPLRTAWPAPGELASLRRQLEVAQAQLRAGRHAPGDRGLRQAVSGLARRGIWGAATDGSLALASSLLKRGRPRDAIAVLDMARDYAKHGANCGAMVSVGVLSGVALVDLARLDEAASVLGAARAIVRAGDDVNVVAEVVLAQSRCRFWRGEYVEATEALDRLDEAELRDESVVRIHAMRARLAIGCGDLPKAVAAAVEARRRAASLDKHALIAEAACAAAFVHMTVGDEPAVRADAADCVACARITRDPLRAFRVQLLLAEQLRRCGRQTEAVAAVRCLNRVPAGSLPPILRRRREMLADLVRGAPMATVTARHVAGSGMRALGLFLPRQAAATLPAMWDDAIETLRLCQEATDERATLTIVCGRVQRQLRAVAVALFGIERGGLVRLAVNGGHVEPGIAERVVTLTAPIAPHRVDQRVEAAAPVRYGGAVIGAFVVRWAVGSSPDPDGTAAALGVATTAVGPLVGSALASRQRAEKSQTSALVGVSAAMVDVRRSVERAGPAPFSVLVEGESGSGKELVAREVHRLGTRRDRPFCTLNCAALPDDLVESELFGHARGAFTGAVSERMGVFEEAHTGTLLLDEVGELSARAQAKVLRVIQEGELRRVGENVSRRVDVRIVSATNRRLTDEVAQGRFRLDLLYRLDVIRIVVPPLRERQEDVPLLVDRLWREAAERIGCRATLGAATVAALAEYDWPGNVRELQNVLASLAVRVAKRGVVQPSALPPQFDARRRQDSCRLDEARRVFDERFVRAALLRNGGRRSAAAAELGLTRQGLTKLMNRLGLTGHEREGAEREGDRDDGAL